MDDRLRAIAHAARAEAEAAIDVDDEFAATMRRTPTNFEPRRALDRQRRRAIAWVAAAAVVLIAGGLVVLRSGDDDTLQTVDTETTTAITSPSVSSATEAPGTVEVSTTLESSPLAPTSTPRTATTAPPTTSSATSAPEPVGEIAWRPVSTSPLSERSDHSLVWTGDELLVWGGVASVDGFVEFADGAAYDPVSDTWRELPDAGIAGRLGHSAVWTGDAMLVWGGVTDFGCNTGTSDGVFYEPATDSWLPISPAPGPVRTAHSSVWTGDEMIVWGGFPTLGARTSDGRFCDAPPDPNAELPGLAYNPLTDSWRIIAAGPEPRISSTLVAADGKVLLWGGISAESDDWLADGWSYDPATDQWSELPIGPLSPRMSHIAVWAGDEMIVAGGQDRDGLLNDGAAFDTETGRWRPIPDLPAEIADAEAATTDRYLLVLGGCCSQDADAFTLDLLTDTWASLPLIPSPPCRDSCSRNAPVASLGDGFVTWGGMTESGPEADTQWWADGSLLDLSK